MAAFLLLIAPWVEFIKIIGIVGGSIFTIVIFAKKVMAKMLDEKFVIVNDKVDALAEQIETIKATNLDQMEKINKLLKFQEELCFTDQHVLRALITGKYYEYIEQKNLPLYERECISLLYKDYKMLHGNSFIDSLYEELMTLPYEKL